MMTIENIRPKQSQNKLEDFLYGELVRVVWMPKNHQYRVQMMGRLFPVYPNRATYGDRKWLVIYLGVLGISGVGHDPVFVQPHWLERGEAEWTPDPGGRVYNRGVEEMTDWDKKRAEDLFSLEQLAAMEAAARTVADEYSPDDEITKVALRAIKEMDVAIMRLLWTAADDETARLVAAEERKPQVTLGTDMTIEEVEELFDEQTLERDYR